MEQPSYFSILTADVRYDKRLSDFARLLYSDITALCNKQGYCSATNDYFAQIFDKSRRTISATIASLAETGYIAIEIIRDGSNAVVTRKIWVQANAQKAAEQVSDPIEENFHRYGENSPYPIEENFQDIKENNTSNNNNPHTPKGEDELFDQFWQAYPKRVAKKPARRAWDKLHVDIDLLAKILAALAWQKRTDDWQRDGGRYIPNPATWLNGGRWEDEHKPVPEDKQAKGGGRKWLK